MLEILYQDEYIVAVNKPHGLLVHASPIARNATEFALQIVRDQLGKKVYPAHRIDRKTSGILVFSLDKETDSCMQQLFASNDIQKKYLAIVRGHTPEFSTIDYALKRDDGKIQEAQTDFRTLQHTEIPYPSGKFNSSRYSLVEAHPKTGRFHQLRKHFAHIFHPIIGDRPHGCNKQNKFWKDTFQMETMLLHASSLSFTHPVTTVKIEISATPQEEFTRACQLLNISLEDQ